MVETLANLTAFRTECMWGHKFNVGHNRGPCFSLTRACHYRAESAVGAQSPFRYTPLWVREFITTVPLKQSTFIRLKKEVLVIVISEILLTISKSYSCQTVTLLSRFTLDWNKNVLSNLICPIKSISSVLGGTMKCYMKNHENQKSIFKYIYTQDILYMASISNSSSKLQKYNVAHMSSNVTFCKGS